MKLYIEGNKKYGHGYQVRAAWDNGWSDVIDFHPYSIKKAVIMAQKALSIINRRAAGIMRLRDVLEIDLKCML